MKLLFLSVHFELWFLWTFPERKLKKYGENNWYNVIVNYGVLFSLRYNKWPKKKTLIEWSNLGANRKGIVETPTIKMHFFHSVIVETVSRTSCTALVDENIRSEKNAL